MSMELTLGQATLGIVAALPKELAAVRAIFGPTVSAAGSSGTVYDLCAVPCVGGQVVVASALLPGVGNTLAAAHTSRMLADCKNLKQVMMVGIAGAIPCPTDGEKHVRLGDIVVSGLAGVFQFDFGKYVSGRPFEYHALPTRPSALLLQAVGRLESAESLGDRPWEVHIAQTLERFPQWRRPASDTDILDDGSGPIPHPEHPKRRVGVPHLFVGAIASSNAVLKDANKRDAIASALNDGGRLLCCVEMEGAGVQDATWLGGAEYLVVRGTCDYCNDKKNNIWQEYAAVIAAAFARSVAEESAATLPSSSAAAIPADALTSPPHSFGKIPGDRNPPVINISAQYVSIQVGPKSSSPFLGGLMGGECSLSNMRHSLEAMRVATHLRREVEETVIGIKKDLAVWNYEQAEKRIASLGALLARRGDELGQDIVRTGLIIMARVYINRAELGEDAVGHCVAGAKELLGRVNTMRDGASPECDDEIMALTAALISLEKGAEHAVALISGSTSAYAIRTRTALLLNQQKFAEAMAVVEGLEPHEWWCDVAVKAYALNDQVEKAQVLVRWAAGLSDRSRYPQCVVRLAEGLMARALAEHDKRVNILPQDLTPAERGKLELVVETLQPVLHTIHVAGRPTSGLDMAALQIAWQANHLLQRREAVAELLGLMNQWTPVPVDVARGVVSGYIAAPPDLPDRLRRDHPGDLDAGMLAALIECDSFGQYSAAFAKAKGLLPLADSNEKKEELFKLFHTIWQSIEGPAVAECEAIAGPLVAHNPRLHAIFEAGVALRGGDADRAIVILDGQKAEDDPFWLQFRANALLQKRRLADAVDFLLPAAKITRHADLLHKAGDVAFRAKRYDVAVWCYERLAEIQPRNLPVRNNLAHIYTFVLHDLAKAAEQFRALHAAEPGDTQHTLNLAICLAQLFRPDESLPLYDELCRQENPPLPAILGRAQLYHNLGRPAAALTSLEPFRERLWSAPDFLMTYMTTAHAAGNDAAGHEALMALNRLREQGTVKPEVVRIIHKDEGLDILKQSFKQSQDRDQHLHVEMLKGRMPWVWAEQVSKNAIYWGWRTRTQEIGWIWDEPTNRARYCIYSTNGFHARESEAGGRALLQLECPAAGTRVVADVSALITLHRLGLLDAAAEYFGEVLVPSGYLPTVLEDGRQMVLHQRSRQQSAEQIVKQANAGRIVALAEGAETLASLAIADEYSESSEHRYRLRDLIGPVRQAGAINDADFAGISRLCAKPSAVDEQHPALAQFQDVMVDLTTMETVANAGLLDALAGFYRLRVSAGVHREVIQRLDAVAYQEETRQWHMDLWSRLRGNARFKFVPHTVPEGMRGKDQDDKDYLPFLACFIAQETKTPLLADDRVCQAFTLNEMTDVPRAAFGSDVVAMTLMAAGKLEPGKTAAVLSQLMAWRYRFIAPSPEVLKLLADQCRENPPGQALQRVAEYVHDCMRDTGLFGGPENTEMKDSMAMRLYLTWGSVIAEFLVLVWADEKFTPECATRLTEWSCRELLPSCPRVVDGRMKVRVSEMTPMLFLSHALLKTANHFGEPRMADAMTAMKNALRLRDDEYMKIVTGVLNDTARTAPKP